MTTTLNIIADFLQLRGIQYFRLDGTTPQEDRSRSLKEFNSNQREVNLFLLSTRAGGVGINLQAADTVILFDSDWNPQMDLQAISRTHRIGQSKKVLILRLISKGPDSNIPSIEQKVLDRAHRKLLASRTVLAEGVFDMGGTSGGGGGSNGSNASDVTTSSDCSSVLEMPRNNTNNYGIGSSSSNSLNQYDEGNYCLDDEYTDTFEEANIDAEPSDWYIGLGSDKITTMRSLFESSASDGSGSNESIERKSLRGEMVVNLGDDHYLSVYDSMDFSHEGIRQICRRQTEELPISRSSSKEEYPSLLHNTMDSAGPLDVVWKSWLGPGVKYNVAEAVETEPQSALGKRRPRNTALYEIKNGEVCDCNVT